MCKNTNLEIEEFRKIPSLWFLYEVNCDGTIIRNVKSKKKLKIKKVMHRSTTGYMATVAHIKGKFYSVYVHKVVAECWIGRKPDGMEIDHINRDSLDNSYTNLRYVTHSENMRNRDLSEKSYSTAMRNLSVGLKVISKPVLVDGIRFDSRAAAAMHIYAVANTSTVGAIKKRLNQHRKNILGHEITYLTNSSIAETRHDDHCEQLGKE